MKCRYDKNMKCFIPFGMIKMEQLINTCETCKFKPSKEDIKKPPIGLVPKYIIDSKRHYEVCEAITRYYQNGLEIPIEWIEEYNQYIRTKNNSNISTT